jgi:hypothetical protein
LRHAKTANIKDNASRFRRLVGAEQLCAPSVCNGPRR